MSDFPLTLEGRNVVYDALLSDQQIEKIFVSHKSKRDPKIKEILLLAQKRGILVKNVNVVYLRKIARTSVHQGIIAMMGAKKVASLQALLKEKLLKRRDPLFLLYNRLDYEQNLGAILRSSWGAGVDAVIVSPQGVNHISPVVARTSMGGSLHVPLVAQSLFQALAVFKKAGIPIVGVDMKKGHIYSDITLLGPVAFLFGGEDSGISDSLAKYCDIFVHIPMASEVPSLNVNIATAIILFEKLRQERDAKKNRKAKNKQ